MDLCEIMWLRQGEKEAKSLDRQAFSHLPDASRGVVIHSRGYASLTPGYKPQLRLGLCSFRTFSLANLMDLREI